MTESERAVMTELESAARTVRPTVHTLQAQQEERAHYDAERGIVTGISRPTNGQRDIAGARDVITATKMREALSALLAKTNQAATHAATIAAMLDGGPSNVIGLAQPVPETGTKRPLFAQFAQQVVSISQAVDLIEAQLKRIDGVLS